jgi:hypothetical protein
MSPADLVVTCMERGVLLSPALDLDGPEEALDEGLEKALSDQKLDVLRALLGPAGADPRAGPDPPDWRFEWLREMGMLAMRLRDGGPEAKARLRPLLLERPRTLAEWLVLGGKIAAAEADLTRVGKLPAVPNFGP